MMSNTAMQVEDHTPGQPTIEELAGEVATILLKRLKTSADANDVVRLLQIVFLDRDEVAELLKVKPKTINTWVSKGLIPVRYANSEPRFLLAEILAWTLPKDDKHQSYRLSVATSCKIASNRLAAIKGGKDGGTEKKG